MSTALSEYRGSKPVAAMRRWLPEWASTQRESRRCDLPVSGQCLNGYRGPQPVLEFVRRYMPAFVTSQPELPKEVGGTTVAPVDDRQPKAIKLQPGGHPWLRGIGSLPDDQFTRDWWAIVEEHRRQSDTAADAA